MAVLAPLKRNPVVFVPVLAWTFLQAPELLVREVNPALAALFPGQSALLLLVTPLFHAGLLGMADEALDGYTSLDAFAREARANYVPMLVAYLLMWVVTGVVGVVALGALLVGGLVLLDVGTAVVVLGAVVLLAIVAAGLAVLLHVQFYGHAIVLDDTGAVAGFKRSAAVVRRNLLPTLRYSVVGLVVGTTFGLGVVATTLLLAADTPLFGLPVTDLSTAGVAAGLVLVVVVQTVAGSAFAIYSVAFYRRIRD